ncbi:glycoside hydrolase family 15 protein [Chloroflexota bacterium]
MAKEKTRSEKNQYKSISDYGITGNMISAALVAKDGSIDWCCLPRFDSPSVFAAILDEENGGRFQISPKGAYESSQAYLPETNILKTTFKTETGTATLTDFMPCYHGTRRGLSSFLQIHRLVQSDEGRASMEVVFQPKLDYARGETSLKASNYGVEASKGKEAVTLSSNASFKICDDSAISHFTVEQGQKAEFVLRYGAGKPLSPTVHNSAGRLEKTSAYWQELTKSCTCVGPWQAAIVRSYLTLHLLIYQPTGSIIAAATTSLPEEIGGERNWDYRYSWLRDASFTLDAFNRLGHKDEAVGFMKWLLDVTDLHGPGGQILYGIDLEDPLDERILDHLEGYRKSRPVRIGNGAYKQRQLDVFGEVLEAAYNYVQIGGYISQNTWQVLEEYVNAADRLWKEPDNGIWEVRGGPFHFVHSKLMCWVALDRGIKIAESENYGSKSLEHWRRTVQDIRKEILTRGWNPKRQSFTQHFTTDALDSSNLLIPLYGFLPVTDDRIKSTIERTVNELSWDGLLRRYSTEHTDDGLSGSEGVFIWCSFWLVRNLIRLGRLDEARALYERLLGYRNHLGLFSEMVDPSTGEALGNFPQALSHLGIIIAGLELTRALQGKPDIER